VSRELGGAKVRKILAEQLKKAHPAPRGGINDMKF